MQIPNTNYHQPNAQIVSIQVDFVLCMMAHGLELKVLLI